MCEIDIRPHPDTFIQNLLELLPGLVESVQRFDFSVMAFAAGSLMISDCPVLLVERTSEGAFSVNAGFATCGEIWFPISSNRLLVLRNPSNKRKLHGDPETIYRIDAETHNAAQIARSYQHYFGPPALLQTLQAVPLGRRLPIEVPGHVEVDGTGMSSFDPAPRRR